MYARPRAHTHTLQYSEVIETCDVGTAAEHRRVRGNVQRRAPKSHPSLPQPRSCHLPPPATTRGFIKLRGPAHPAAQRLFTKSHGNSMEVKVQKMSQRAATRTDPGSNRYVWRVLASVIDRLTRADIRIGA